MKTNAKEPTNPKEMYFKNIVYQLAILVFCFLFSACAQIGTITGGPQDKQAPEILEQTPSNNTTNFNVDKITLNFNEFVELVNPTENCIISPRTNENPEYTIKGKSVIIDFSSCNLDSNTTYKLSCKNAIRDYTEGNLITEHNIVFSTGEHIDSLYITGHIIDAYTLENATDVLIVLHNENTDSTLYNIPYQYVTISDKKGYFCFTNLPDKDFYISAILDKNKDFLFSQSDEKIAFHTPIVRPYPIFTDSAKMAENTNIDTCHLLLFEEEDTIVKYLKKDIYATYCHRLIFKNKVQNFKLHQITPPTPTVKYMYDMLSNQDTILVFFLDTINEPIDFQLEINNELKDTINLNPAQKLRNLRRNSTEEKTFLSFSNYQEGSLINKHIIQFLYPIDSISNDKLSLIISHDTISDTLSVPFHFIDSSQRRLEIDYNFDKEDTDYKIFAKDSVFFSIYGWCNDSINIPIKTQSFRNYGNLKIDYQFYEENRYITQLINSRNTIIQSDTIDYNKKIYYKNLLPDKYKIRVIVDQNRNEKWDSGNYLQRKQPEPIIYFPTAIDVRANWTIEETFNVQIPDIK